MRNRSELVARSATILANAAAEDRELTTTERRQVEDLHAQIDAVDAETRRLVRPVAEGPKHAGETTLEWLRSGGQGTRRVEWTGTEQRFLATSPAEAGGNLRPEDFESQLWRTMQLRSPVLSAARVFATRGGRDLALPIVTSSGSAVPRTEGSAIAGVDPEFGQIVLRDHQYAQLIKVSRELLADTGVDLTGYLAEAMASNIDQAVGPLWTFGGGTTEPEGYATGAGTAVTGGTASGRFGYDDLADMLGALAPQYQAGAAWMMSPSAVTELRKVKDDNDRPLWEPAMTAGAPATLFGRPVYIDPHLANVGPGGTSVAVLDPSAFAVRLADGGVLLDRSDDAFFAEGLVAWRAVLRTDSAVIDPDAVAVFVGGTA